MEPNTEYDVQQLLTFCEENFECQDGNPSAYFTFTHPISNREATLPYVVYAIRARSFEAAKAWMVDNVLLPLARKAGPKGKLYWRKKFTAEDLDFEHHQIKLRVRLGVIDERGKPVQIPDMVHRENERYPLVDPRLDEGGMLWPSRLDSEEVKELKNKLWDAMTAPKHMDCLT